VRPVRHRSCTPPRPGIEFYRWRNVIDLVAASLLDSCSRRSFMSPSGGSATIEPASDYVSRFRGDGRQSAMSLPFRSAYVSTFRGPSPRRARSGHPRPCGAALPRQRRGVQEPGRGPVTFDRAVSALYAQSECALTQEDRSGLLRLVEGKEGGSDEHAARMCVPRSRRNARRTRQRRGQHVTRLGRPAFAMYLQSGKVYFGVWFPVDCPRARRIVAVDLLRLSVRRLIKLGTPQGSGASVARTSTGLR
jgi:hypothetical protein